VAQRAERFQNSGNAKTRLQSGCGQSATKSRPDFAGGVMKFFFKNVWLPVVKADVADVLNLKTGMGMSWGKADRRAATLLHSFINC
jgi:hypothetical protein